MKKTFYLTIFATLFIGSLAGFGATNLIRLAWDGFSAWRAEKEFVSVDFTRNLGGPDGEVQYVQTEERRFLHTEITYEATEVGYHKIDKNYSLPRISADSFLIADLDTGDLIDGRSINEVRPIASVSKMMTALVAMDNYDWQDSMYVTITALNTYGRQGNLRLGEEISVKDLLHALLLTSSNDASEVLAEIAGRKNFLVWMNTNAQLLGMNDTDYIDPSGLSQYNVSTVADLFELTAYIYEKKPEIFEITRLKSYRGDRQTWYNNSRFRNDKNYLGGKNGYTDEAKHTLVAMFELPIGENSEPRNVAIILLGSDDTEKDTRALVLYLLRNVEYVYGGE